MPAQLYSNLSWLPRPPADFNDRCRDLQTTPDSAGLWQRIHSLANYALDENQLSRLAKTIAKARANGASFSPLASFRLGVLSNSTLDFIAPALVASAARHGIALECITANYDQVVQEALSPGSAMNRARPDAVLIAIDYRSLPLTCPLGDSQKAGEAVESALSYLETIRASIKSNSRSTCILQTFAPPPERLFGSLDRAMPGAPRNLLERINSELTAAVFGTEDVLLDVGGLAETVGLAEWHSPEQWNLAKLPFSNAYLPLYADHVARVIAAMRGKSRKCLVLDLDNTLWGGVIGDDGLEGIQVAQGDATGEAHLAVQRLALDLRNRGVVLAVSSKNSDGVARLPFQKHPEMLLREEHITVFQANWNDKATNIQAIAEELSLGIDSMVLLDDNPVERGLVRTILPSVAVPELPTDPALYARTLAAAGYFESVSFSPEDFGRAHFYQGNARRVSLKQAAGDIGAYLASLNMEITFKPFDAAGRARIAQLINKSNQYNLTTRRYTEAEVAEAEKDPDYFTLQVRLSDIFGDNGMISVVICRPSAPQVWTFDTWLMSCRVLGRRVENMVLQHVIDQAKRNGVRKLCGVYIPTEKNRLVEDHYSKLGFEQVGNGDGGVTRWELNVDSAQVQTSPMTIRYIGFESAIGV